MSSPDRFPTRVSLQVFGLEPDVYARVAVAAEEQGFDTLWLADHVVTPLARDTPYPYHETGDPGYAPETPLVDVLVMAAHLAALTRRIRLASGVLVLPLRNPLLVARAIATVQALSGGRFALGIGAGWLREEFDAIGEQFDQRGARMDEMLAILRELWTGAPVEHEGSFYRFDQLQLAPAVEAPPVYVGGDSERALRRAAALADGWYGPACDLKSSLASRGRIEKLRVAAGREGDFDYAVRLHGAVATENVERYRDAGFGHVVVGLGAVSRNAGEEAAAVERLAGMLER